MKLLTKIRIRCSCNRRREERNCRVLTKTGISGLEARVSARSSRSESYRTYATVSNFDFRNRIPIRRSFNLLFKDVSYVRFQTKVWFDYNFSISRNNENLKKLSISNYPMSRTFILYNNNAEKLSKNTKKKNCIIKKQKKYFLSYWIKILIFLNTLEFLQNFFAFLNISFSNEKNLVTNIRNSYCFVSFSNYRKEKP